MIDKHVLRAKLRAVRDAFVAGNPPAVLPPRRFLDMLGPGMVVASYVPLGSEADPTAFDAAVRRAGGAVALPQVIDRASPIDFRDAAAPLEAGPFGLTQPGAAARAVDPDVILAPLVGFDPRCNRLGQGAGHYDRAFTRWPNALRIGIAWSVQQVAVLPIDPWDVALHLIVTETNVLMPEPNR